MGQKFSWEKLLKRDKETVDNTIEVNPNEQRLDMGPIVPLDRPMPSESSAHQPTTPFIKPTDGPKAPLVIDWADNKPVSQAPVVEPQAIQPVPTAHPTPEPVAAAPEPTVQAPEQVSPVSTPAWGAPPTAEPRVDAEPSVSISQITQPPAPVQKAPPSWDGVELTPAEQAQLEHAPGGELKPIELPSAPSPFANAPAPVPGGLTNVTPSEPAHIPVFEQPVEDPIVLQGIPQYADPAPQAPTTPVEPISLADAPVVDAPAVSESPASFWGTPPQSATTPAPAQPISLDAVLSGQSIEAAPVDSTTSNAPTAEPVAPVSAPFSQPKSDFGIENPFVEAEEPVSQLPVEPIVEAPPAPVRPASAWDSTPSIGAWSPVSYDDEFDEPVTAQSEQPIEIDQSVTNAVEPVTIAEPASEPSQAPVNIPVSASLPFAEVPVASNSDLGESTTNPVKPSEFASNEFDEWLKGQEAKAASPVEAAPVVAEQVAEATPSAPEQPPVYQAAPPMAPLETASNEADIVNPSESAAESVEAPKFDKIDQSFYGHSVTTPASVEEPPAPVNTSLDAETEAFDSASPPPMATLDPIEPPKIVASTEADAPAATDIFKTEQSNGFVNPKEQPAKPVSRGFTWATPDGTDTALSGNVPAPVAPSSEPVEATVSPTIQDSDTSEFVDPQLADFEEVASKPKKKGLFWGKKEKKAKPVVNDHIPLPSKESSLTEQPTVETPLFQTDPLADWTPADPTPEAEPGSHEPTFEQPLEPVAEVPAITTPTAKESFFTQPADLPESVSLPVTPVATGNDPFRNSVVPPVTDGPLETPPAPHSEPVSQEGDLPSDLPAHYRVAHDLGIQQARDRKIGDVLLENKLITERQLERALERQSETKEKLGQILVSIQAISEKRLLQVLAAQKGVNPWHLEDDLPSSDALMAVPEEVCRVFQVLPVAVRSGLVVLAMRDTSDNEAIELVRQYSKMNVEPVLADEARLAYTIDQCYGMTASKRLAQADTQISQAVKAVEKLGLKPKPLGARYTEEETRTVVSLVDGMIEEAVRLQATDLHFEPGHEKTLVRARIQGRFRTLREIPADLAHVVAARLRYLAEIDTAESKTAQHGSFVTSYGPTHVHLLVNILPARHGSHLAVRIVDRTTAQRGLDKLGFDDQDLRTINAILGRPNGLVIVAGPEGSGKTTTLYAALRELAKGEKAVMSVESPVEYDMAGVTQVEVDQSLGLGFGAQLRNVLRQMPDVVMVSEVSDRETADLVLRASLTGKLVLAAIPANDSVSAIGHFLDLGVEPRQLGAALAGATSPRLVRTLCPHCKKEAAPTPEEAEFLRAYGVTVSKLCSSEGCTECGGSGYAGRKALHEVVAGSEEVKTLVARGATLQEIATAAGHYGYLSLEKAALAMVVSGDTSLEEAKSKLSFCPFKRSMDARTVELQQAS